MIQQAIAQVLTPLYDGDFSANSYGFRAGRNAHQAVRHVESGWKLKRRYAVDCDLKGFFDTVNHDRLLAQLREKIGGGKLLRLIGRYLRAGVEMPDGSCEATPLGVPQGGPLSPLLANIVLDPLDKEFERRGHHFASYADDLPSLRFALRAACRLAVSLRSAHHPGEKRGSRRAGDGQRDELRRKEAGVDRQPHQKQKCQTSRLHVPRVPNQSPWESEVERESVPEVQTAREGTGAQRR